MADHEQTPRNMLPPGTIPAPIHASHEAAPLHLCVLVRAEPDPASGPFLLLRELPQAKVYLGVIADSQGRPQELVELWVQALELRDLTFSGYQERLSNSVFDQRWQAESQRVFHAAPDKVVVTGMEDRPSPVLIGRPASAGTAFVPAKPAPWTVCRDDALLDSFGLPPYSTSPYRYLYQPQSPQPAKFVATSADAPANAHVVGLDHLKEEPFKDIFNPHGGGVRCVQHTPLRAEDYLQLLEGKPWAGAEPGVAPPAMGVYRDLALWSAKRKGSAFLLHGTGTTAEQRNEIFFLKLSALVEMFEEVRSYVKAHQLPLLNLAPASFAFHLHETGRQFPALWTARCRLVLPGQAYPLKIRSTEQKYFLRLGAAEPSPFLPEGLGAHSFGIGSVRLRNVLTEADGLVLEGTLVAEDYLRLDPHDLLWFKLPFGEEKLEFHAHVYTSEAVGPREARFRTVPTRLSDPLVANLKKSLISFSKAPYEIWPLLSSPCDLHSLAVLATRVLLANSETNFPVLLDDILGLARRFGEDQNPQKSPLARFRELLQKEPKLAALISPGALVTLPGDPANAWAEIHKDLWIEAIALLLQLFPGAGCYSFCKGFGDVSPLALETVFDKPIEQLENLCLRLRSVLIPTLFANEELASVVMEQLAGT